MTPSLSVSLKPSRLGMVSLPFFPSSLSLHPCVYLDCILPSCGEGCCQGQGPWQVNSTVSGSQMSSPPASTAHQENQSLVLLGKEQVMYESVCGCQVLICVPVNKKPLKSVRQEKGMALLLPLTLTWLLWSLCGGNMAEPMSLDQHHRGRV